MISTVLRKIKNKRQQNSITLDSNTQQHKIQDTKHVKFTFFNDKTFRKLKYKIAYKTNNPIKKYLYLNNTSHKIKEYNKTGVY